MSEDGQPRVLHVAETITGGVSTYLQEVVTFQATTLGRENLRVLVPERQAGELASIDPAMIATFARSGRNLASFLAFARGLHQTMSEFQPAIVHLHSTFAGALARPLLALRRSRPRVVYCPHGWSFLMDTPARQRRLCVGVERLLGPLTDIIVNISHYEDREARAHGLPAEKCVVVRNAVSPAPPPTGAASPFDDRFVNLLFVGRFDRQKGIDLLLRAMADLAGAPIRLWVIGGCVHEEKHLPTVPNVTVLGWRPREELDRWYAAADAVVMPSRWEGFGLVAIEAMRNGTAVIASRRGALPELIDEGRTGLLFDLQEDAPRDLTRILRTLEKPRLRQMGRAAREHFLAHFTAEQMNRGLLAIYRGLLRPDDARSTPADPVPAPGGEVLPRWLG